MLGRSTGLVRASKGTTEVKALIAAAHAFFERYNRRPRDVLSNIGSDSAAIT
jgi:hypothetical protein